LSWKKENAAGIIIGTVLLIGFGVVLILVAINIPPTPPAEQARLDSLAAILNAAQPTALLEDTVGRIEVISSINLKDQEIYIWSSKAVHNELWRYKIRSLAKKMRHLYNPGDADYYKAADRLISQISVIKQTL
jgi:hypothetical protein